MAIKEVQICISPTKTPPSTGLARALYILKHFSSVTSKTIKGFRNDDCQGNGNPRIKKQQQKKTKKKKNDWWSEEAQSCYTCGLDFSVLVCRALTVPLTLTQIK